MGRPRPLSVPEVATALQASDAYVRRLLSRGQLFGTKVGPVWAVYPDDLEAFQRLRRLPGRPRKAAPPVDEKETRVRIDGERGTAGTDRFLRKRGRTRP
jgi:excisionase family DNA binding protein